MRGFFVNLGGQEYPVGVAETLTDMWDARSWIELRPNVVFGLDVETSGLAWYSDDFKVRMLQVSDGEVTWLFPTGISAQMDSEIRQMMRTETFKVATHTRFDPLAIYGGLGVSLGQRVIDTHLLARIADPAGGDADLKSLMTNAMDMPELEEAATELYGVFKEMALARDDEAKSQDPYLARSPSRLRGWGFANIAVDHPVYERYAALDALSVAKLAPAIVGYLDSGPRNLLAMEMWLAALATSMQARGVKVNVEATKRQLAEAEAEIAGAEATICRITGLAKARSPKRVDWLVSKGVKFNPKHATDTGAPSLKKDFLPPLVAAYPEDTEVGQVLRAIHAIAERSNLQTNLRNFLSNMDADGRVHPEIHTLKARTHRMSITDPALQTLSKSDPRIRGCLDFDDGMTGISVDFGQVEARVAAALSEDKVLLEHVLSGNLHGRTAAEIFGDGFKDKETNPDLYAWAKVANFQSLFGGGAKALAKATGIPLKKAREIHDQWNVTYASVSAFRDALGQRREVITPTGRVLPVDPEAPYAALNYMIQSTARDLLVMAVYRIVTELRIPPKAVWLFVHDEIILQVPSHMAEQIAKEVEDIMGTTFMGVPIVAEAEILGSNWGKVTRSE